MGAKRKLTTVNFTDKPKTRKIAKNEKLYTNSTFEDFAGSEDEFHINRDKISFDGRLESSKNKRWQQDESLELSDNEIFPYPESDSEEDQGLSTIGPDVVVHDAPEMMRIVDEDINKDIEEWDASKQEYYNHDLIETEAEALEEEAEAKRLQQKKLSKMSAVDFDIEEDNDLDNHKEKGTGNVVTEVLQNFVISADMQPEERQRILHLRYPEFDPLANDLLELYPVLQKLQVEVENESSSLTSSNSPTTLKFRALSAYVGTLTMYFAIISSPGFGSSGEAHALNPEELREHSIMDTLLQCRELWSKVKNYSISTALTINPAENYSYEVSEELPQESVDLKKKIKDSIQSNISAKNKEKSKIAEDELQKLNKLIKFPFQMKVKNKLRPTSINEDSDGSDFGEEDSIDAKLAIEKANNKRSLRFYTSKITQKASKRVDAGKNAGGDEDIPHRERLRDRQARLNSEAQRRALQKNDMDLGVQSESDEDKIALQVREAGNDYYDQITRAKNLKKDQKLARKQAEAQANLEGGWVRVVESEVGNDGKRAIGYVIEKNKGLAPKRKKDVRNPRVKKRKKYEEKKKKLASTRAIYKGGEERGGYGGEKTGIKTRLVKSIKL